MKVEELNNGFKPIEIKITIESEEELCSLVSRLCVEDSQINKSLKRKFKHPCNDNADSVLWKLLKTKIGELQLKI